jgi:Uma2 family endonuclease
LVVSAVAKSSATSETLIALGDAPCEVIHGVVVRKADPTAEHGDAQAGLVAALRPAFHRRQSDDNGPGGWWILSEVDVELERHEVVRPDLSGWRRERVPTRQVGRPVRERPDWVCEILSISNAKADLVDKLEIYHRAEVPHYWIVDPATETLTVHRWTREGYLIALRAGRDAQVRAEPFGAIELRIGALFGDE